MESHFSQKLQLLESGNLVLSNNEEIIKWQTFNFPTNVLLEGQRLSVATHLTSFPTNNTNTNNFTFFSFEIHHDKLALYFNPCNKHKYSYWEFQPLGEKNITFIELGSNGLNLFDDKFENFSQIVSTGHTEPLKFLALDNSTGNFGLYYYSPYNDKFEPSFEALRSTCDLPLTCSSYDICTFSNTCSCIMSLLVKNKEKEEDKSNYECKEESRGELCGKNEVEILELEDSGISLQSSWVMNNITSKRVCGNLCLNECKCASALYTLGEKECKFYDIVRGAKQVKRGSGLSYFVKVPKGVLINRNLEKKYNLQKWVLILIVGGDGLVLFLVAGGLGYFMVWKRQKRSRDATGSDT